MCFRGSDANAYELTLHNPIKVKEKINAQYGSVTEVINESG